MSRFSITFLIVFMSSVFAFSQQAGIHIGAGIPMGEFKDNVNRAGFGLSGEILLIKTGPASMGLNLGYFNYGNETRRERFSTTIPDVMVDVTRSNNIFNFHFLFQVAAPIQWVVPYAEGLFGGSYIFTETQIGEYNNETVASSNNFDDFAWSYGGGAGLMIHLYTDPTDLQVSEILLDLKVRYLLGSEAQYLKEGSIYIENGYAKYNPEKSKTDLLTATVGVTFKFNSLF